MTCLSTPSSEWRLSRGELFYFQKSSTKLEDLAVVNGTMFPIPGDDGGHEAERVPMLFASAKSVRASATGLLNE